MNKTLLKVIGIVAIVLGCVALFLSGTGEPAVVAVVGAVFVLAGIIASIVLGTATEAVTVGKSAWAWLWKVLQIFVSPPQLNSGGTVIHPGKTSWKRVSAAAAFVVGLRQLAIADRFGAIVCLSYALVMGVISALTKT